eukprot:jgi/Mesvir1/12781/Mv26054-RA.1
MSRICSYPCAVIAIPQKATDGDAKRRTFDRHSALAVPRRAALLGFGACVVLPLASPPPGTAISVVAVDEAAAQRIRDVDAAMAAGFKSIDRQAERRKQMANAALRGTSDYDDTCRVEDSCREKPKDIGEAAARMWEYLNNAELGLSSAEKLEKMGMDTSSRVNSYR